MTAAPTGFTADEIVWSPDRPRDGTGFVVSEDRSLLVSRDGGASWEPAFHAVTGAESLPVTAIAISPGLAQDGLVLAGIPGGVGRSRDRGVHWDFAPLPGHLPLVTCLLVVAGEAGPLLLAGTLEDGVARSVDGGETWAFWNGGLFDHQVTALNRDDERGIVTAETPSGVYASTNGGRSWHPHPEGS